MSKLFSSRILSFISFLLALIGLTFFFLYRAPFLSNYISLDANRNLLLLSITTISLLFYIISIFVNKHSLVPAGKWTRIIFVLFPLFVIISTLFSGGISNSFFGKYVFLQSGATYFAIISLTYIVASQIKNYKRLSWLFLFLANIFITIPSVLGIIFAKFGWLNLSNKIVYFIDNWDTVALASGVIVVISLIYFETIASSKLQKVLSGIFIVLHTLLLVCIVIPDIWYALFFSSLFIFLMSKNKKDVFKKFSFYILIVSFLFSILFAFSNGGWTTNIANKVAAFTTKYSEVNYSFVKPRLDLSMSMAKAEISKGRLFGAGPSEFYKVWQSEKPQSVVNSNYWGTDFSSSYSSFTTLLVTLGVFGTLLFLATYFGIGINLWRKIRKDSKEDYASLDYENRFYLFASTTLFIFSFFIFLFFANVPNAIVLFCIATAFALSSILKWKEVKNGLMNFIIILVFVGVLIGLIVAINRTRATYITTKAISTYQADNDLIALENKLLKATKISNDDANNRLLAQFYIFKTQMILNSTATDTETLQKEVLTAMNNAINAAQVAINLDKKDYNNYLILGSVYEFLMTFDKENRAADYGYAKDAYNTALSLYPKNPSIYLTLAQLEYNYGENTETTIENLNKSLQVKPNYSQAFYVFSQLAVRNNDGDSALQYATQAVQADPQNIDALLQYGILLLNKTNLTMDELNQAYTAFVTILTMDPNNITAGYYLGVTYVLAGEYDQARNIINILKQLLPEDEKVAELEQFLNTSERNNPNPQNSASNTNNAENNIATTTPAGAVEN